MLSAQQSATVALVLSGASLCLSIYQYLAQRRRIVVPNSGPTASFYNAAQAIGNTLYVSGQVAIRDGGMLGSSAVADQAPVAIENMLSVLKKAGAKKENILKTVVYLDDMSNYAEFNDAYCKFFTDGETRPARVCFATKELPLGAKVEIECVAFL